MQRTGGTRRRGLTREAIVAQALEIGDAEGLEAVSLRRLASELGVTPMALYRHVRDKEDLVNAMMEVVLEGLDLTVGFRPSMRWTDRVRRALLNFKDQMEARPLALPLAIAYSGEGPPGFWKMNEDLLGILLGAGFKRRQAVVLIRILSNLVSGYLLLMSQGALEVPEKIDAQGLDLLRRRVELAQLSLPRDRFPHSVESAREVADVWLSDPDVWWQDTVDLIVFGLERMLERSEARSRRHSTVKSAKSS
jgi:TetR/AcrR family transcriptional regulator, tetracycline repressor protein